MPSKVYWNLPEGRYSTDSIRGIAIVIHLDLLAPSELFKMIDACYDDDALLSELEHLISQNIDLSAKPFSKGRGRPKRPSRPRR